MRCPVRAECAAHALAVREPYGVWGGLTEDEREELMGRARNRLVPSTGATSGANATGRPPERQPERPASPTRPLQKRFSVRRADPARSLTARGARPRTGAHAASADGDAPVSPPSAGRRPRQLVQGGRHRRHPRQVRQGERDDLPLDGRVQRDRPGALGAYGLDRELRQDRDAQPRADQADHRRIVVGGEVDAGGEAGRLADLDQLTAAARAARDPRLVGKFADGDRAGARPAGAPREPGRPDGR